jgi:GrpB-like predicted nucleotidyltransferase (UPF0157 family)
MAVVFSFFGMGFSEFWPVVLKGFAVFLPVWAFLSMRMALLVVGLVALFRSVGQRSHIRTKYEALAGQGEFKNVINHKSWKDGIKLEAFTPRWHKEVAEERLRLIQALTAGNVLSVVDSETYPALILHTGSTAIKDIRAAKRGLHDLILPVKHHHPALNKVLEECGYHQVGMCPHGTDDFWWFNYERGFDIHEVVPSGYDWIEKSLNFVKYLSSEDGKEARDRYAASKESVEGKTLMEYQMTKSKVALELMEEANQWASSAKLGGHLIG